MRTVAGRVGVAALGLVACGGTTDTPVVPVAPGSLSISLQTTASMPTPPTFSFTVDNGSAQTISPTGATLVSGLSAGAHVLAFTSLPAGCSVTGANPRTVVVASAQTALVDVAIACAGGGLRIAVSSSGPWADPDGYVLGVDALVGRAVAINGETIVTDSLAPGAHSVRLSGLATGCATTDPNPQTVTVISGAATTVNVVVVCATTHPAGDVSATVAVAHPYGLAISTAGALYIAELDAGMVGRVDLPSTTLKSPITVGLVPSHVAFSPNGKTAYVANQGSRSVSVIDVASGLVTATIPVTSDAWNVLVSLDGARLYVTTDQGVLHVINTATNAIVAALTLRAGDAMRGLALDPTGRTLYVAGRNTGTIYSVDTRTNTLAASLAIGGIPQRVAVSPDGATLYVANEARGLDAITLATGVVRTTALGGEGGYGLAMSPDGVLLYVTVPSAGLVQIVDRASAAIVKTLTIGGRPRVVAFTAYGDLAVVANESGSVSYVR